jgi:hypothetical protein
LNTELSWSGIIALVIVVGCLVGILLGPVLAIWWMFLNIFVLPRRFKAVCEALHAWNAETGKPSPSTLSGITFLPVFIKSELTLHDTLYGRSQGETAQSAALPFPRIVTRGGAVFGFLTECDFDRSVYITCEEHRTFMSYLSPERRAGILSLFNEGFAQLVYVRGTKTLALISGTRLPMKASSAERASRFIDQLSRLVPTAQSYSPQHSVAPPVSPREKVKTQGRRIRGVLGLIALVVVYLIGVPASRQVVSDDGAESLATLVATVLFGAYTLSVFSTVKGTSTAHRGLLRSIVVGGVMISVLSWFGVVLANQVLDQANSFQQEATFTGITESIKRRSRKEYYANFNFYDPAGKQRSVSFHISASTAENLKGVPTRAAVVFLKPGAFGIRHAIGYDLR